MNFEKVTMYPDAIIPTPSTVLSAGYDLYAAEDTYIPSYSREIIPAINNAYLFSIEAKNREDKKWQELFDLKIDESQNIYPQVLQYYPTMRPTLVPTGVKINLDLDKSLEISVIPSLPKDNMLFMADAPKIIDVNYSNNLDTDGQIYIQLINLSSFGYTIKKGDKIAQGVIRQHFHINED